MIQVLPYDISARCAFSFLWQALDTDIALLALFCVGFVLFRFTAIQRLIFGTSKWQDAQVQNKNGAQEPTPALAWMAPIKQLEANWVAGRADLVLSSWRSLNYLTLNAFKIIIEASIAAHNGELEIIVPMVQQILARHAYLCSNEAMAVVLDVLPEPSTELALKIKAVFDPAVSTSTLASQGETTSTRAMQWEQRIISAIESQQLSTAAQLFHDMYEAGHQVPVSCLLMFERCAPECADGQVGLSSLHVGLFTPEAIVALLDHAAKSGNTALLRDMHKLAKDANLFQTPSVCEALLRAYAVLGDSRAVEVFDQIAKHFNPSESVLTSVISLCAESRHTQMAERALRHARCHHGGASLSHYAALVKVYMHARLFEKTCELVEMMKQDDVRPDTVVYGALIKAAVESGRLDLARRLFRESGNPDILNYMSLIRAAGREKDVPKALALLKELEEAPLSVDIPVYNCVLDVCVSSGSKEAAANLLKHMEERNQLDIVSYNTYLKLLFASDARSEVDELLHAMRSRGLRPNAVTYNSLVKNAILQQDMQRAWQLVGQMEHERTYPDAFTCSILMKGMKHTATSDDVDKVVDLIQRASITPDEVLVNCLLDAYVRLRNIPRLMQILEQFKSPGVVPSLHACAMLIKAYGHSRRFDKGWALWRELIDERKVIPNDEVFAAMIDACVAQNELHRAACVFREVKPLLSEFSRGPAVFATLIKACVSQKNTSLAMELYQEVNEISFTCQKVTYNTLIDALVRQDDMNAASAVFRDMALRGAVPDLISFATLIKGHCARGCLDQALQLLGRMQRQGISPDAILYNSILDGCAHKQMRTLTEQVLRDMETAGIAPSNFTVSILIKLYGRCSDLDTAFHVVETYPVKYNFKLNAQVYTCLMSACIANGALPRALEVFKRMIEAGCRTDAKTYQTLLNGCIRHDDLDAAARLIQDALHEGSQSCLDHENVENVLFMMARRGRGLDIGLPLLEDIEASGIVVSKRVCNAIRNYDVTRPHRRTCRTSP